MTKDGGILYVIGATGTGLVKIGCTAGTVTKRLKVLQTGQPFALKILATMVIEQGLKKVERSVHKFLANERQRGEWFATSIANDGQLEQLVFRAIQWIAEEQDFKEIEPFKDYGFTHRLKVARKAKGWSQTELGTRSGVHPMALSRLERGEKKDVNGATVRKLARALDVTTDYLLGMEEA